MRLCEIIETEGYSCLRLAFWPRDHYVSKWEEHMWYYVDGHRLAPWCPTPGELCDDRWELWT